MIDSLRFAAARAERPAAMRRRMSSILAAIVHFVERTAAIARTGLAFSPHGFDAERYEELLREAAAMRAALDGAVPRRPPNFCGDGAPRSATVTTATSRRPRDAA